MRLIAFALLAALSVPAAAGTVDVNLSNETIEAKFYANAGLADWTFGALYNRDQKDSAVNVGLLAVGDTYLGSSRVKGGIGGKLYAVSVANSDVLALGLGGQFALFPADGAFGIGAYGFYAPRVVTALDGERFWEAGVRAEVEVIKNSSVYAGYRRVRADLDDGSSPYVDRGAFAGIQIRF
jgi:YfaZ precursor